MGSSRRFVLRRLPVRRDLPPAVTLGVAADIGWAVANPTQVAVPLQCHFAQQDDWCTPAAAGSWVQLPKAHSEDSDTFDHLSRVKCIKS